MKNVLIALCVLAATIGIATCTPLNDIKLEDLREVVPAPAQISDQCAAQPELAWCK